MHAVARESAQNQDRQERFLERDYIDLSKASLSCLTAKSRCETHALQVDKSPARTEISSSVPAETFMTKLQRLGVAAGMAVYFGISAMASFSFGSYIRGSIALFGAVIGAISAIGCVRDLFSND